MFGEDDWDMAAKATGPKSSAPQSNQIDVTVSGTDDWEQAAAGASTYVNTQRQIATQTTDQLPKLSPDIAHNPGPFLKGVGTGAAKSAWETMNSLADVMIPSSGHHTGEPTPLGKTLGVDERIAQGDNAVEAGGEAVGAMGEQAAEFMLGDFLAKDLTMGEKFSEMGKIWKSLELHPRAKQALKLGLQSMRQGTEAGALAKAHGASNTEALETAGMATGLGAAAGLTTMGGQSIGKRISAARDNSYIQVPEDYITRAYNPPEEVNLPKAGQDAQLREFAKFDQELKSNMPYILGTAERTGLHPVGRRSMMDLTLRTADEFHDLWNNRILGPMENAKVGIPKGFQGRSEGGFATLRDLDTRLNEINDTLNPKYEAGKGGLPAEAKVGAEQATDLRREAAAIRKTLYDTLQANVGDKIGVNVGEVKARNGQLRDLADNMSRQWQRQRVKAFEPVGDASTVRSATEKGVVKTSRAIVGDPRDKDIRTGWELIRNHIDPVSPGIMGPSVPPPTNEFVSSIRSHNIPINPDASTITWSGSSPAEVEAHQQKIAERAATVRETRRQEHLQTMKNKAAHWRDRESQMKYPPEESSEP